MSNKRSSTTGMAHPIPRKAIPYAKELIKIAREAHPNLREVHIMIGINGSITETWIQAYGNSPASSAGVATQLFRDLLHIFYKRQAHSLPTRFLCDQLVQMGPSHPWHDYKYSKRPGPLNPHKLATVLSVNGVWGYNGYNVHKKNSSVRKIRREDIETALKAGTVKMPLTIAMAVKQAQDAGFRLTRVLLERKLQERVVKGHKNEVRDLVYNPAALFWSSFRASCRRARRMHQRALRHCRATLPRRRANADRRGVRGGISRGSQ